MNKDNKISANKAQKSAKKRTEIGEYNQKVRAFLAKNPVEDLMVYTIKIFKDNAKKKSISNRNYNIAVEEFNQTHGFVLEKKGAEYEAITPVYNYINYPYMDRSSIKKTMDNYRLYVSNYNEKAIELNKEIKQYNNTIVTCDFALSEAQKKRKKSFETENKHLFSTLYNEKVAKENVKDAIIPKKLINQVKYQTEMIFNVILGFYVSQLRTRNANLMEMKISTRTLKNSLPKLKLDHRKLATHKISEITRLNICKKTAQNHVKRLREAGVLVNYKKINQNHPIQINFNPSILVILDGNSPKSQTPDNQFFLNGRLKELHYNSVPTKALNLKTFKIKDCASTVDLKCGSAMENQNESNGVCPADSYENTTTISKPKKNTGGGDISKVLPQFLKTDKKKRAASKSGENKVMKTNFLAKLMDEKELAQKLSKGYFNDYKGFTYSYLASISNYTHVDFEDFRKIVIQDVIKSSAKIWKNHKNAPYVGEWKKTITALYTQFFAKIVRKETLIEKLHEYRWKIDFARKWFIKKEGINALYPFAYFDKTRTQSNEIGFYGLHEIWKTHLKNTEKSELELKNLQKKSTKRKRKLSVNEKFKKSLKKFYNGKINYKQLLSYVETNLPHEYSKNLSNLMQTTYLA